jgi:hypothetical protein
MTCATSATQATATTSDPDHVLSGHGMTVLAATLALRSDLVLRCCDRLEMCGIDAAPVPAQMVKLQFGRDGADKDLVDETMCYSAAALSAR